MSSQAVPSYLAAFARTYETDPRRAALDWFAQARFGLFIHYGLYSILGEGEWVMYHKKIRPREYAELAEQFRPDRFDPNFITDLACEAEMRYVNLVTCHHDSFCLWDSKNEVFNSMNAPAHRDLVGELAEACGEKGLGLFCYYTYGVNWRHPYFFSREYAPSARPDYATPEESYLFREPADFRRFIDYAHEALRELLTGYGPIAGAWLDLIMNYYAQPKMYPVDETYALIRSLQPQTLVSFKMGANGDEDFASPERSFESPEHRVREQFGAENAAVAAAAWEKNRDKHNEICDTMQERVWSYNKGEDGRHKDADEVIAMLAHAGAKNCNLLLNTGPLPDGSVPEEDIATLREVGRRIRDNGWPEQN